MEQKIREVARNFIKSEFKYPQHAENTIVDLLEAYPSLLEGLKKAKRKGVDSIYIGGPTRTIKPLMEISDNKVIFHQ